MKQRRNQEKTKAMEKLKALVNKSCEVVTERLMGEQADGRRDMQDEQKQREHLTHGISEAPKTLPEDLHSILWFKRPTWAQSPRDPVESSREFSR